MDTSMHMVWRVQQEIICQSKSSSFTKAVINEDGTDPDLGYECGLSSCAMLCGSPSNLVSI